MSYKPYDGEENHKVLLHVWALRQMSRGAGWACAGFVGVIAVYVFLQFLAGFLPPESKEAPSPYNTYQLQDVADTAFA